MSHILPGSRRVDRSFLIANVVLLLFFVVPNPSAATPILDQDFPPTTPPTGAFILGATSPAVGQTFTVGITGYLTRVEVAIAWNEPSPDYGVGVSILTTINGYFVPDVSQLVATAYIPPLSVPTSFGFGGAAADLSSTPFFTAGERVMVALFTAASYKWLNSAPGFDAYPGGQAFAISNAGILALDPDAGFRTFMEPVPEPGTILLLGSGLAAGYWRRQRRVRQSTRRVCCTRGSDQTVVIAR